jgi:hypothetical protein
MHIKISILYLLLIAIFPADLVGQSRSLSLTINDSITKQPVAFASIKTKNGRYADADERGNVRIIINSYDTIEISRVGYKKKMVTTYNIYDTMEIMLTPFADTLITVVVKPLASNWTFSNFRSKGYRTINFSNDSVLSQVVLKISLPASANGIKLTQVKFLQNAFAKDFLRLHVYKVNELGLPGDELLSEVVIVQSEHLNKGVLTIPMDTMNLYIDGRQFFVGLQWLTKKSPTRISHKDDIGLAETNSLLEAKTYYQGFTCNGSWYQIFMNGIRIYNNQTGEFVEKKFKHDQSLGNAINLKIEVDGTLY